MGSTKVSESTTNTQTSTPTPEETELNRLLLERTRASQNLTMQAQGAGLNLINQLLTGQNPSGELFQQIGGISPQAIGTQAAELTRQNLPQFQGAGLLDSGVMQQGVARSIANELLFPAEQFNIGAKQNLLNLALSGQAEVQQPIMAGTNTLASNLQGLRTINSTGSKTTSQNPFLQSFYSQLGSTMGGSQFKWNWSNS